MEDFYIMKKRNKIVAFLLAGVIAAGHGSVVYAAGYGSVVYEDVAWDLCALNEERMKLEVQEKNTDNDAAGNDQADIEERESPQSTSEYADIGIASVLNYVNLRAEPSVESEALGKLYNNSAATVLETVLDEAGEEWYLVSSGSVENAYVKAEYVKVGDEDLARGVSTRYATVTTTTLFVRTEPGTEASVLTMLPEGEDVVVYDALDEYGICFGRLCDGPDGVSRGRVEGGREREIRARGGGAPGGSSRGGSGKKSTRRGRERGSGSSEKDTGRSGKSNGTAADTKCATGATKK